MRISDWSSDVCSSDLVKVDIGERERPLSVNLFMGPTGVGKTEIVRLLALAIHGRADAFCRIDMHTLAQEHYSAALTGAPPGYVGSKDRKSVVSGKSVSVRVDLGGRRIIKKKKKKK